MSNKKDLNDIWVQVTHRETLNRAWEKVRSNKGAAGEDGVTIPDFGRTFGSSISMMSKALKQQNYEQGEYRKVFIKKKSGGRRMLTIPTVSDRVVHTALALVLTPILEPLFEKASFAYRPGRSVQQAVSVIERWRDEGYIHVIEADIVSYFDAVQHERLLDVLLGAIEAYPGAHLVIALVEELLENQAEALGLTRCGLAQGSPLSPLLANLYLDVLDEEMSGRGVRIVRFADDFVILCKKRKRADEVLDEVRELLGTLGLKLHPQKSRLVDFEKGFEFLGYLFVRSLAMRREEQARDEDFAALAPTAKPRITRASEAVTSSTDMNADPADDDGLEAKGKATRHASGDRILYVMESGRRIVSEAGLFSIISGEDQSLFSVAHHRVNRIEIGPGVECGFDVIDDCLSRDIDLVFTSASGMPKGRLEKPNNTHGALQFSQASMVLNTDQCQEIAAALVDARIRNQRTQLFRLNRNPQLESVERALASMKRHFRKVDAQKTVAELRGIEGAAGADYWPALGLLSADAEQPFRRQRPALTPLNATLNYLTALLERDVMGAVRRTGLHPGFGFLHTSQDRADALIFDMMEPFRAPLTEGLAAYMFNARRLNMEDFTSSTDGSVRIGRRARTAIIKGYENAVAKRINVTGAKRKLAWRPMMAHQGRTLATAIRQKNPQLFTPYLMEA